MTTTTSYESVEPIDGTVLPMEMRRGPSSTRSNYEVQNTIVKPNIDYNGVVKGDVKHNMVKFGNLLRIVEEGPGKKASNGAKGYEIGAVRQGPGPLCCFDDQVIEFDESKGAIAFEVTKVRCPLAMFCNGYIAHITMTDGDEPNTTKIHFDTAHDFHPACRWIPCCIYPCVMPLTFDMLFKCIGCEASGECCCCPKVVQFMATTWTNTCCPCCAICCG